MAETENIAGGQEQPVAPVPAAAPAPAPQREHRGGQRGGGGGRGGNRPRRQDSNFDKGGDDLARMRARTLQVHDTITRLLTDREVRTEVVFADHRHGFHRWRRDRLRYRTTVGMGDAMMTDPQDFDFEVTKLDNSVHDEKITCSGTLRNLGKPIDDGLDVKCSGNRKHLIHIDHLGADESKSFSETFDVSADGERPSFEVLLKEARTRGRP